MTDDKLLKEKQMAELLEMSSNSLRNRRNQGQDVPPFIRMGVGRGTIRYPYGAYREWLAERTTGCAPKGSE